MRGALRVTLGKFYPCGIIPAHAGSTCPYHCPGQWLRDHPRACGEHYVRFLQHWYLKGSSPRMRGALVEPFLLLRFMGGIIPAHAGSTEHYGTYSAAGRDHPRACGEHGQRYKTFPRAMGSSVVRLGVGRRLRDFPSRHGIIPAHAGSTYHNHKFLV